MLKKKFTIIISFLLIIFTFNLVLAQGPVDFSNHWAQEYIISLLNENIMTTYPDGSFKPDQEITRGEFSFALAKKLNLTPEKNNKFNDLEDYPEKNYINALVKKEIVEAYPDNTFRPDKLINRDQAIFIIVKALGIKGNEEIINLTDYNPFLDVSDNHPNQELIKIASKLGLIQHNPDNRFYPEEKISRAEAAFYISKLNNFNSYSGYITDIYPASKRMSINTDQGQRIILNLNDQNIIGRNNRIVDMEDILKTDKVFVITDNFNNIKYLKAYGMITQTDLATEVSRMTQGILEPTDVSRLAEGNTDFLAPKLTNTIQEQLINQGLTDEEVEAITKTEWNKIEELSKNRLSEAIAIQTGLPLNITASLLNGDWNNLKTFAQIELVQRVVQEVLSSDLIS